MTPNLHDAVFRSLAVVIEDSTTVTIKISYMADENSRKLTDATIKITNAGSTASTLDFVQLASHARFGNVSDWSPAEGRGVTFIHLAGGTISVFGDEPLFVVGD